ncbi:hypothetical protein ACFE04_027660 [Oxalis oulophora]
MVISSLELICLHYKQRYTKSSSPLTSKFSKFYQMSFDPETAKKLTSAGPWGGQDGSRWDDGVYSSVRQVVITHGTGVDSIQIEYDMKGASFWSQKHGGTNGYRTDKVNLDCPNEYLIAIRGHYGSIHEWGPIFVRSLTFESNERTYGPYGIEQGTSFSFSVLGAKIVGFHGKSGWYLDSIGVHLNPIQDQQNPKTIKTLVNAPNYIATGTEHSGYQVIQGSIGKSHNIVVAVRRKDDSGNHVITRKPLKQHSSSEEESDAENKKKKSIIDKVPTKPESVITYGPWGGNGGTTFDDGGSYTGIRRISLSRSIAIVSMKVQYDLKGQAVWGSKHGGTGGFKSDKIYFDYPAEVMTHITGSYGPIMYMGPNVIKSVTFHTNKGKHGPYGEEVGASFTSKIRDGKIVGFLGKEGLFLDAIGVHFLEMKVATMKHPFTNAIIPKQGHIAVMDNPQWSNKLMLAKRGPAEEVSCGVIKEPAPCGAGPWGGDGGKPWDDGVFTGIKQIYVTRSDVATCSIQIEYDRSGQSVWSIKHGGQIGTTMHRVKLDFPHEVLTCITGYYCPVNSNERMNVIKSLTFNTSRGKYGPFGEEIGTYFTSTTTQGMVVGFHGRASSYLDAIGVHMQHWLGNQKTSSAFFKKFTY